jgi:hypothetical protein
MVEQGDAFRDPSRVIHRWRDVEDARPKVYLFGRGREITEKHLVGRQMGILGQKMMLSCPCVLEADTIGGLYDRNFVHDAPMLVTGELRHYARAIEQAKFHGR